MGGFDEKAFLLAYKRIPRRAFRLLMDEYRDRIYTFCLRAASRREDAEDLAQEVFIRTWKGLDRFRGGSSLATWIYRIAWNVCASYLDRKGRALPVLSYREDDDNDETHAASILDSVEGELRGGRDDREFKRFENRQLLDTLFEQIPEAHKLILTMYYLQELTYEEIAAVTNRPMGSVKATLHRAKTSLRAAAMAEVGVA